MKYLSKGTENSTSSMSYHWWTWPPLTTSKFKIFR